jgi:5'-phosphate synthase pdxT subunit
LRVGVLALQGDVLEHRAAFADLGVQTREVRLPHELSGLDALVLPGGESTTLSLLLRSSGLEAPLREALASGMPALGTCAGLILLAREVLDGRPDQLVFGALDVAVRRNAYGRQRESFESELMVPALGGKPVHAVFIRAPLVERVGPRVEVLARGPSGEPVLVAEGGVMATAFHPELTGDPRVLQLFVERAGGRASASSKEVGRVGPLEVGDHQAP